MIPVSIIVGILSQNIVAIKSVPPYPRNNPLELLKGIQITFVQPIIMNFRPFTQENILFFSITQIH
jgi:hypothetical protein